MNQQVGAEIPKIQKQYIERIKQATKTKVQTFVHKRALTYIYEYGR